MNRLFTNIRFWVLSFSLLLGATIVLAFQVQDEALTHYVQTFGLIGMGFLYLTLLVSPLVELIPTLSYKGQFVRARRALGVSAFFYGCLHGSLAFFFQLGGFAGLRYLNERYLVAIAAAAIAATILLLLALTSFDYWVRKLGPNWKVLHRYVYLAGFLLLFHALRIGSLFTDYQSKGAKLSLLLVGALLIMQASRLDLRWRKQRLGIITLLVSCTVAYTLALIGNVPTTSLSVHSERTNP